ncbi:MAG: ribokinase [Dehalococcoidia bacterium]|nr:ribokinase [Dehalococcoidia bacterium]
MNASRSPVVVVLGGINMDLVATSERMPNLGETIFGTSFHTAPGGKGANQAVAAARLGAEVRMVGRVGDDQFGPTLLEGMRSEGIDVSGVAVDPDNPSGVALILLDEQAENMIVAVYGANLACDDAQVAAVDDALDGADVLLLQLETPLDVALSAVALAKEWGATVVWDPAPALKMGHEAYRLCDVLTPNQAEVEFLTGIAVTDPTSAEGAAKVLVEQGVRAAVVTLGSGGAFFLTRDESGLVPPFNVDAIDSVAAGDAFAAGLGIALAEGESLAGAVKFGSAAGALAVTKSGAQEAMPYRAEVDALIARS